jgi:DNA ligase (NAD+)
LINKEENRMKNNLSGKVFVITGTLSKPRDDYKKLIESYGATVTGSVSKKTNYLLAGANVGASKTNKARECGTQVITEDEFNQMIGG